MHRRLLSSGEQPHLIRILFVYHQVFQHALARPDGDAPSADAEVISLAKNILDRLGLKNIELHINSIGCPTCRAKYHEALRAYFEPRKDELCDTCKERLVKNPMRLLDCKSPEDREIAKDAPVILDYLCEECSSHFTKLKKYLDIAGISYIVDPKIVRGLDYYTKTVFEFITTEIGAQGTVCGGGRYDGLIEQLGGHHTPALGFGMGLERLLLVMDKQGCDFLAPKKCDIYFATMGEPALEKAMKLSAQLREYGYFAEFDLMQRGLKAQMKYANKIGAAFTMVLGDNELAEGTAKLKEMKSGEETKMSLDNKFETVFEEIYFNKMMNVMDDGNNPPFAFTGEDK